jgi:hypothetical protein
MLPSDCPDSVVRASSLFEDPRVRHFHDRTKLAGRTFAKGLLPIGVAWDTYLFYPPGAKWSDAPPHPARWSHQLGRIDPQHFHPREQLFIALAASTAALLPEDEREGQ